MDIVKMLNEIQFLKMESKYTEDKIRELKERKTSIKSSCNSNITPGSHVTKPKSDNCIDLMISVKELEKTLEKSLDKMYRLQNEVNDKLTVLDPKERIIIKLHYFEGETIEYICGVINYSFRHTRRLHKEALEKLKKMAKNVL